MINTFFASHVKPALYLDRRHSLRTTAIEYRALALEVGYSILEIVTVPHVQEENAEGFVVQINANGVPLERKPFSVVSH